jgi:hypothetical protein
MKNEGPMLEWMKRRASVARAEPEPDAEASPAKGRVMSGKYLSLYKYLENRYATTVVLTFAEVEDLLGFMLPDVARLDREWWTNPEPTTDRISYSDSWILASRTATPNLLARTVVFERAS